MDRGNTNDFHCAIKNQYIFQQYNKKVVLQ